MRDLRPLGLAALALAFAAAGGCSPVELATPDVSSTSSADEPCSIGTAEHCSECGDRCGGDTPVCERDGDSYTCVGACARPSPTQCDGVCVRVEDDPDHCGDCDQACGFENGVAACEAARCVLASCEAGFDDCNGESADGCETDLSRADHCGGCGVVCGDEERCVDLSCTPCERNPIAVSGVAERQYCGWELGAGRIFAPAGDGEYCTDKGTTGITLAGVSLVGASRSTWSLCGVKASGSELIFYRDYEGDCAEAVARFEVVGATPRGTVMSGGQPICKMATRGLAIDIYYDDWETGCDDLKGTIEFEPVCADTL